MARLTLLVVAVVSLAASGCSPYVGDFQYMPHPALAEIPAVAPDKTPPLSAFATIVGIFRGDSREGIPESVDVRFRLENNGPHTVTFDPNSLQLSTGDLISFLPPIIQGAQPVTLAPTQTAMVDAFFPFPAGRDYTNTDLRTLSLRWRENIDASQVQQVVSFRRTYPYYYSAYPDPYWGYPWFYGGAVVVVGGGHHWR
jgi:hypothetical protein